MWYQEILSELKMVLKGNTLDALLPSLLFVFLQSPLGLTTSALVAVLSSFLLTGYRIVRKQKSFYALLGVLGVLFAAGYAAFSGSAENYYLPRLFNGTLLVLVSFGSILFGKPLAALLSHLSRGWPMGWFLRKDVKPAYREVTFIWSVLLLLRLLVQWNLYRGGDLTRLFFINFFMGTPATIVILVLSYVYGIYRLKKLKGPSVDEYLENAPGPYKGQKKGF
ncbi:DUF3159 domain-containing protein [Proteiniclasticum ruminis]|uniref:Intracellular septation protein A n=1 Tax=Proteiniclasticum ruminis TaxID=398199 RepID=A0A1I4XM70_9CLOT|nr:DUF3159 domain-containing protein [Proteiniclasticum ruminis]SFN26961.1 Protein of unknown function [Proteiniclasticum ruminis]